MKRSEACMDAIHRHFDKNELTGRELEAYGTELERQQLSFGFKRVKKFKKNRKGGRLHADK